MPRKAQTAPEQENKKEAVNAPVDTEQEQEKGTEAPIEDTSEQENKKEAVKVYNFTSKNRFLSCVALGVQFIDGKASVTDLAVARALATFDGVELVEE